MDKKGIIGVVACVLLLVWWQFNYTQQAKRRAAEATLAAASAPPEATAAPDASVAPAQAAVSGAAAPAAPVTPTLPETTEELTNAAGTVRYEFTSRGGGIAKVFLLNHEIGHGEPVVLNRITNHSIAGLGEKPGENVADYTLRAEPGRMVAERTTADGVQIVKTFTLPTAEQGGNNVLLLDISHRNTGSAAVQIPAQYLNVGVAAPIHSVDQTRYTSFDWSGEGKFNDIPLTWFDGSKVPLLGISIRQPQAVYSATAPKIDWAAVSNQYFTIVLSPLDAGADSVWAVRPEVETEGRTMQAMEAAIGLPAFELAAGETKSRQFSIYAGAKEYSQLEALGHEQGRIMKFGMFKIVSVFLLKSMNWLYDLLGNYAAAIIVLTLVIKSALWPLQNKSTKSMKKMQALSPKMTELREKYKDDPTRMNQELMKLYKDYGVNPFGGCLPMVVQIPIFFGFYSMLGTAVELRHHGFWWVDDLSLPDTVAHIPGVGWPINILPLLMAGTMLWQMSLTPKSGDAVQQRVFMFVPLIFIVFCYNFASALALYWTTQNLFSIVQLYLTRNQTAPVLQKVTAPRKKKRGNP